MTDITPEEAELIRQYLAGSLSEKESRMVETRMVDDPEFRNEVELTQALRQGMRELHKRGEIAPLLSPRRAFWNPSRVALAASLATLALGAASFLFFSRQDLAPAGVLTESLHFVQTRSSGAGPDAAWERPPVPGRLEMRFDVGLEPAPAYQVLIRRLGDEAALSMPDPTAVTAPDGEAVWIVDGRLLSPGDYELRLVPQGAGAAQAARSFTLRVTGP